MSLLDLASYKSYWRGIEYCRSGNQISCEKYSATVYHGLVSGNKDYEVEIDIAHPRRSRCNCPYAEGSQIICKHKIALYLTAFPEELKRIEEEQRQYELEIEERKRKFELEMSQRKEGITKRVKTFSKEELQRLLIDKLMNDEYEACSRDFGLEDEQCRLLVVQPIRNCCYKFSHKNGANFAPTPFLN